MINFLPIAILGYALNGGSTLIDKILLNKSLPSAFVYVFYISALGGLAILLIPFGVKFEISPIILGSISGLFSNLALLAYFQALIKGEASIVAPIVGGLNPLFSLLIGGIFLNQILTPNELAAFFLLILGAVILTANIWSKKLALNNQLLLMITSGLMFALSYITLRQTYLVSNFVTGLTFSRLAGLIFILFFLFFPKLRHQIFANKVSHHKFINKTSILLLSGQSMGAISALLINYAITFTNPALVNSLFGVQYLVIIIVALFLAHEHRSRLLEEDLTKKSLIQKIIGAGFLSIGVFLLGK